MKNVLITGGTSGIGLGIARAFAAKGYNLLINGLEQNGPEIAKGLAAEHSVKVIHSPANLMQPEQIREMVALAEQELGQVDILINNAGIQHVAPVDEFPEDKWDAIISVNMSASFHAAKAVWPGMKARGFGRIINIASAHALRASEYKIAYVTAKHGIAGLTKVLALEGAPHHITCNAICPGYVRTPLVEAQIADQAKAHNMSEEDVIEKVMLKKQAVKQFVTIDAIANLALYLASETAGQLTGAMLPIDGGWSAQ
ncbi:3-hydroxybutyrate dehydrogenase [Pontibacter sp. BT310]|uniref:3-hydroxybutyrate dehydrogenase n=1 Tax=Pontibacter populi TaxID=890055 RepID=A0ABS6XBU6_9BACT|nr:MULTISPECIES: 3-hydroxybutyrate dehydrogenase [Pontibacter]MBJ6117729.1 3-hydroxybutyrate dehydrogenase [Pontibacter sp. BT310]MBR0570155.1 3-hydroxybutyrate dehydrogenase [Microvirga sp. STS03]MBW3364581.1 3-hydroxybutyrate dehydrogenase [Pontibacter populi]